MKLNLFQVVVMAAGATLLYAGITGNNPATVVKDVLNNRSPNPVSTAAATARGDDTDLPSNVFGLSNGIAQEGGAVNLKVLSN